MRHKKDKVLKKSKRPASSIVLYIASIIVTILGIAFLLTNIVLFQESIAQYVAQGYPAATVFSNLLPQFLSGIYEPIAVYGGIALILFSAGLINVKISKCLKILIELGVDGTVREVDAASLNNGGSKPCSLKSTKFEANEVKTAKIETDEHDSGTLKSD